MTISSLEELSDIFLKKPYPNELKLVITHKYSPRKGKDAKKQKTGP